MRDRVYGAGDEQYELTKWGQFYGESVLLTIDHSSEEHSPLFLEGRKAQRRFFIFND